MGHTLIILSISQFLVQYGYYGLFAGSFLSALFIPLGADVFFVGMLAAGSNPWLCLLLATTGGWLGGILIYMIGYAGNQQKIHKWLHIKGSQIVKEKSKIDKYGSLLALLVWIPVFGDISNVALGFYRTNKTKTFILMFIGRMCRFLLWIILYKIYDERFVKFIDKI